MATRWKLMDKMIYIISFLIIALAWFDSRQVAAMKSAGGESVWNSFWNITSPAFFWLSISIFFCIGLTWYLYSKDKSEALALWLVPTILIIFSVRDLIFYAISSDTLADVSCWADVSWPIRTVSDALNEVCPTGTSMIITACVGLIIAYYTYKYLKEARW